MEPDRQVYFDRAVRGWLALIRTFAGRRAGLLRSDDRPRLPGVAAHLWPLSGALCAGIAVAHLQGRWDSVEGLLEGLERYWQPDRAFPAYASDVVATRVPWARLGGGDIYYDDNAWIGLILARLARVRPGLADLGRAAQLWRFAQSGWDAERGGVFWVEQGRGIGRRNHDRNLVSTAPNAALALHLVELGALDAVDLGEPSPRTMYAWVEGTLDAGPEAGSPGAGPFWDKVMGDGQVDRSVWSYNQGSMVTLNLLLSRARAEASADGEPGPAGGSAEAFHARARAVGRTALRRLGSGAFDGQPAAFHSIMFRNLLMLGEDALAQEALAGMRAYADRAWREWSDERALYRVDGARPTILDQAALVEMLALLAWDPQDHRLLT